MMITPGGKVGVGTNEPEEEFHISGSGGVRSLLQNTGAGNAFSEFRAGANGQSKWLTGCGSADNFGIYQKDNAGGTSVNKYRIYIATDGKVGIGDFTGSGGQPGGLLHILQPGTGFGDGIRIGENSTNYWDIYTSGNLNFFVNGGGNGGYINNGITPANQMNFTGQHRNLMNTSIGVSQEGLIVSTTNKIINVNNGVSPTINESLPYCVITNTDNDKKVFGVISSKEDNENSREYAAGRFVSVSQKENINEERMYINSVGEGAVWVANKNGSLEMGDYITSTNIPGYGGKQADPSLHNYTVGKMTCDCDFSLTKIAKQKLKTIGTSAGQEIVYDSQGNPEFENDLDPDGNIQMVYEYQTRFLQADGTLLVDQSDYETRLANGEAVYIGCFVGCTYHCG